MWRMLLLVLMGCSTYEEPLNRIAIGSDASVSHETEFVVPVSLENWHRRLRIAKRDIRHYIDQLDKIGDESAAAEARRVLEEVEGYGKNGVPQKSRPRLHVVGLYEGAKYDDTAEVVVTDTSSPVILCVCAYHTTRWTIRAEDGVDLRKVIVGGYEKQEIDSVPEGVRVFGRTHSDDKRYGFYGYRGSSSWAKVDSALWKISQLTVSTRVGQYRCEDTPLIVGPANEDWVTQLQLQALRELELQAMAYRARTEEQDVLNACRPLLFRNGSCSVGKGTLFGPDEGSLQTVNGDIHRLINVPQHGLFTLHDYQVKKLDPETGDLSLPDLPRLEEYHGDWPITADTDRNKLYVWGYQLRSVDLQTGEVTVHREGNSGSIVSIAYCNQRKCLFGISSRYDGYGHSTTTITRMNLRGADISHVHLETPMCFRGRPQMWVEHGRLVINGQLQNLARTHSYVYNPDTGQLLFACRFRPRVTGFM